MTLKLYAHPFSSYCQKALIALYENATPFEFRLLEGADAHAELSALWPLGRFPVLVDQDHTLPEASIIVLPEASIIIEHLDLHHPGPARMIPEDPRAALRVRMLDRFFDNYVSAPQQKIVLDSLRDAGVRDPHGVAEARALLDKSYAWLDQEMEARDWAEDAFGLADCAAAPALFYADWTHPIAASHTHVHAYRRRLLARPSFARAVDEARPYRPFFPLGAPDRD